MASVKSPFGRISGRVGNIVFRNTDTGNTISAIPSKYQLPGDEASVNRRTKFSFIIKFSAAIVRNFALKIFWQRITPSKERCLGKIFKTNYSLLKPDYDLSGLRLSDNPAISIDNPEINVQSNSVQVIVSALGTNQDINTNVEKTVRVEGVMVLSAALDEAAPRFSFIPLQSNDITLILNDSLTFNVAIKGADMLLAQRYATKKVAVVLVTKDATGNPVKCSDTLYN